MKKLGLLFIVMMAFLMLPFTVFADKVVSENNGNGEESGEVADNKDDEAEDDDKEESKEVKVYFFHGDGCPHCAEAKKFFNGIEEEYGHLFEIVAYETYYDKDNAELLEKVGEVRDEVIEGVPYILIGNKSFPGYAESLNDEIIEAIKKEYEKDVDDRYDIMDFVELGDKDAKENYSDDAMILLLILVVTAGVVAGVVYARKKTA